MYYLDHCMHIDEQAISEELSAQQSRLDASRRAAAELGARIAMSPVAASAESRPLGETCTPVSLMQSADHVAHQMALLEQSIGVLSDLAQRQNHASLVCQCAAQSAEKQIDTARQVRGDH